MHTHTHTQGVASLWGGNPSAPPLAPLCLSLGDFAAMSVQEEAVVVPMMRGWLGSTGALAQLLQDAGAVFTGGWVCGGPWAPHPWL